MGAAGQRHSLCARHSEGRCGSSWRERAGCGVWDCGSAPREAGNMPFVRPAAKEHIRNFPQAEVRASPLDIVIRLPDTPDANVGSRLSLTEVWKTQPASLEATTEATIQVATANVLSLFAGKDDKLGQGQYVSSRMEALQQQCIDAHVDVAGLQETRHKANRYFRCEHYHVLSGAASAKGQGGTQLWIAKQFQCGIEIQPEHLRMWHHGEQLLIATLQHPALKLVLLVAHAPTVDKEEELENWWKKVAGELKHCPQWPVIGLIDANSRVGSITSRSVGDFGMSKENLAGGWCHEWLLQHEFWLPSTFADTHQGDHPTWYHASGAGARLDYVTLSNHFGSHQARCCGSLVTLIFHFGASTTYRCAVKLTFYSLGPCMMTHQRGDPRLLQRVNHQCQLSRPYHGPSTCMSMQT